MEVYEQYNSILSECLLFCDMDRSEINRCVSGSSPKLISVKKNESIPLPEKMHDLYIVLSGRFNVIQDSGMNVSLAHVLTPGKCFGIAFCARNIPCQHTLQATEKSELLKLSYAGLLEKEDLKARILENLLSITSENLLVLAEKIASVSRGCAVYEPGTDMGYRMVFNRADIAMYNNKKDYYSKHERRTMGPSGSL